MDSAVFRLVKPLPPPYHYSLPCHLFLYVHMVNAYYALVVPLNCGRCVTIGHSFTQLTFKCVCAPWMLDILNSGEPDKDVTETYFSNCITLWWGYTGSLLQAFRKGELSTKQLVGCVSNHTFNLPTSVVVSFLDSLLSWTDVSHTGYSWGLHFCSVTWPGV